MSAMRATETAGHLAGFPQRGAGTDAERRAAVWLASELRQSKRPVLVETFWSRPNWAIGHAWHLLLAVIGSLLSVSHAQLGGALLIIALLCVLVDWATGQSPGRRLTRERASQNVVAPASGTGATRLIITANYDAGRAGLAHRAFLRRPARAVMRLGGRVTPGWQAWVVLELILLIAVAALRNGGSGGTPLGAVQLIPTVVLVLELATLLELGLAAYGPAASDNASGAAVALALTRALHASPPRRLDVELVLQGAGDAQMTGLRRHLRTRRRELSPRDTIVLGIGPCGAGTPTWWASDGSMLPLAFGRRLRALAAETAGRQTPGHRGRGTSPALPGRMAGYPALTIGALDGHGLAPRAHQASDTVAALEPELLDRMLEFALTLVDAIDADLGRRQHPADSARTTA